MTRGLWRDDKWDLPGHGFHETIGEGKLIMAISVSAFYAPRGNESNIPAGHRSAIPVGLLMMCQK